MSHRFSFQVFDELAHLCRSCIFQINVKSTYLVAIEAIQPNAEWCYLPCNFLKTLDDAVKLLSLPRKEGVFYNINFPNCRDEELQAVRVVSQGKRAHGYQVEQRLDGRKFPYYWIHSVHDMAEYEVGSDAEALALKAPSVSALRIDMTDYETNDSLVSLFGP